MIKGLDNFVTLRDEDHRYFDTDGKEYMSTSKFIGHFYKKFDADSAAYWTAKSQGCSTQTVKDKWASQTQEGTRRHDAIELYFKTTTVLPENEDLRPMLVSLASQYSEYRIILNEQVLYDTDEMLAGTSDMVLALTSHKACPIDIGDFKNYNKGINQIDVDKNGKRRIEYMTGPLSHLICSSYNKLCLQLSDYAYKVEKLTGRRIGKLFGHYIDPVDPMINYQVPCIYLKHEILEMIKWKKENGIGIVAPVAPNPDREFDLWFGKSIEESLLLNTKKDDWDL